MILDAIPPQLAGVPTNAQPDDGLITARAGGPAGPPSKRFMPTKHARPAG